MPKYILVHGGLKGQTILIARAFPGSAGIEYREVAKCYTLDIAKAMLDKLNEGEV